MGKRINISQHLQDIDFRTREERSKVWKEDFIDWYEEMTARQQLAYSDVVQAKLQMLSSVLWYLLPEKEYRQLVKLKHVKI